jgi:hypothetical protein
MQKRSIRGFTMMWSLSTLGKHLRIAGIVLTSLRTPQQNSKARILTLGTMVIGLAFVSACKCNVMHPIKRRRITHIH